MMKKFLTGITTSMLFIASGSFAQAPASASSGAPNDAQITEIVVTINNGEIKEGKEAKRISKNKEIKNFANEMISDHTDANKKTAALAQKLKVKPEKSADSKKLKEEAQAALLKLKRLTGKEFDQAYIDSQVMDHQEALDKLDNTLIPNAKNAELKDLLTTTRSLVAKHLEHAKQIKSSLQ